MPVDEARVALLIDADNAPAAKIGLVLAEAAKYGVANIRRAYGNWKSPGLKPWEDVLHEYAIRPIQQFAYSKGKNASDIAMIIDAMDLLHAHKLDAVCIMSSDADFTPLVMRMLTDGVKVYGFGEKKTPAPFVNACSSFVYLESLAPPQEASDEPSRTTRVEPTKLKSDTKLVNLLRGAVEAAAGDDGWANLGPIGQQISNQASFDPRNYGYAKLSGLIQAIDLFEMKKEGQTWFVRDKRRDK